MLVRDVPVLLALRSLRATLSARAVHLLEFVGSFFFLELPLRAHLLSLFPRSSLVKKVRCLFLAFFSDLSVV